MDSNVAHIQRKGQLSANVLLYVFVHPKCICTLMHQRVPPHPHPISTHTHQHTHKHIHTPSPSPGQIFTSCCPFDAFKCLLSYQRGRGRLSNMRGTQSQPRGTPACLRQPSRLLRSCAFLILFYLFWFLANVSNSYW